MHVPNLSALQHTLLRHPCQPKRQQAHPCAAPAQPTSAQIIEHSANHDISSAYLAA